MYFDGFVIDQVWDVEVMIEAVVWLSLQTNGDNSRTRRTARHVVPIQEAQPIYKRLSRPQVFASLDRNKAKQREKIQPTHYMEFQLYLQDGWR